MINWIRVEDELPPKDDTFPCFSIDVLVFIDECDIRVSQYNFKPKTWDCDLDNGFITIPTHWAYLSDLNLPNT